MFWRLRDRAPRTVRGALATLAALGLALLLAGSASANPDARTIYPGDYGPPVKCVQAAITNYTDHKLDVDGYFGPKTKAAVEDFQRFFGLDDDGIVGARTGDVLDWFVSEKATDDEWNFWDEFCYPIVPTLLWI